MANEVIAKSIELSPYKARSSVLRFIYFMLFFGMSSWLTFFNIYLQDKGYSGTQIGTVAGFFQATLFFIVPVWGMLADRNGNKKIFTIVLAFAAMLIFGLRFINDFHIILMYMIILSFFSHPLGSLIDSLTVNHVNFYNQASYGEYRLFGSIGWATGTIIIGYYLTKFESGIIFPVASAMFLLTFVVTYFGYRSEDMNTKESSINVREILVLFKNRSILWFFIILSVYGIFVSPLYMFINLYYREIGASNQIIGIGFAIQASSEIPFFFYGIRLVRKIGAPKIMIFAMSIAILRMAIYSQISDPSIAIGIGAAQGLMFSLFWVSVIDYLHGLIPSKLRATGQALIWAFHIGCGVTIGNVLNGWLFDQITMRGVMKLETLPLLIVLMVLIFYFRKIEKVNNE